MNESHPSLSAGGPKRSRLWMDSKPPQTSPDSFIQVPIRRPGVKNVWKVEQTSESCGKTSHSKDLQLTQTVWNRLEFGNLATGGKDHIQKHVQADWNPRELAGSDHNPLPPAPHSGKDITATQLGQPIQTQNHNSHPIPSSESFLLLFSSALSPSLCLLLFVPFF